jgi:hypothetical protein
MPGNYTLRKTYVDGDILAASDYVADNQQHIDNQDPQHTGDYSDNVTQMRTLTDTGDENTESLAATLAGELERLRFVLKDIKAKINGGTAVNQWYSKGYSNVPLNATVTAAKLANGATFSQYIRTTSNNVNVLVSDTVLVTQAITLTRSRVRIHGVMSGVALRTSGAAADQINDIKLKRNGTTIASGKYYLSLIGASNNEIQPVGVIEFLDSPGAGTYTYTLEANNAGAGVSWTYLINDNALTLEEIV